MVKGLGLGLGLGTGNALGVLLFFSSGIISVVNIFVFGKCATDNL